VDKGRSWRQVVKDLPLVLMVIMSPGVLVTLGAGNRAPRWALVLSGCVLLLSVPRLGAKGIHRVMDWHRQHNVKVPQNVRIHTVDGQVVRCGVLRDPDGDEGKYRAWIVVPLENYHVRVGDVLNMDAAPGNVVLTIPKSRLGPGV
jgi:hypothetical protein